MRTMAEKGLLLAFGATLLALSPAADGIGKATGPASWQAAVPVAGLLAAVCVSGLVEWLLRGVWAWVPPLCFVAAATVLPPWAAMLPPVAYDAARAGCSGFRCPGFAGCSGSAGRTDSAGQGSSGAGANADPGPVGRNGRDGRRITVRAVAAAVFRLVPWLWIVPLARAMRPEGAWDVTVGAADAAFPPVFLAAATTLAFLLGVRSARESALRRLVRRMTDRERESVRSSRLRLADVDEERAQAVRMAMLDERTRIAREIHDNVGHLLTRAIMQSQAGRAVAEATGDETAAQGFAAMDATLNDAMTMVRRSVHDLEDDGTDFTAQIDAAVRSFDGVSPGFAVHLGNDVDSAPAPVARCLATVIRESLTNVVRHSAAHEATVTLRGFPAFWQLVVQDPGPALPAATRRDPTELHGMGIADIESRIRALGGTSSCGPYGRGWRVFVSLPKAGWRRSGAAGGPDPSGAPEPEKMEGAL